MPDRGAPGGTKAAPMRFSRNKSCGVVQMHQFPMSAPAEIHRLVQQTEAGKSSLRDVVVARGPLVIMAHGLLAIGDAADPDGHGCWIVCDAERLDPEEAREVLHRWGAPPAH